jgi:hypothetical protein
MREDQTRMGLVEIAIIIIGIIIIPFCIGAG